MPINKLYPISIFILVGAIASLHSLTSWGEEARFKDEAAERQPETQRAIDACDESKEFTSVCFELWRKVAEPKAVEIDHQAGYYAAGYRGAVVFFPFNFVDGIVTPVPKLDIKSPEVIRGANTGLTDVGAITLKSADKEVWVYDRASGSTLVFALGQYGDVPPIRRIAP